MVAVDEFDLNQVTWTLSGWIPELWRMRRTMELGVSPDAEITGIPARVPGSVQAALRAAGLLPDWNQGLQARLCEWVENRVWIFSCRTPELAAGTVYELCLDRPDAAGQVVWDGVVVGGFDGAHRRHLIELPATERAGSCQLSIVFELPPRWLGQFGESSKMGIGRARYNYTWDWTPRLVQIGIAGGVSLRRRGAPRLEFDAFNTGMDFLSLKFRAVNAVPGSAVTITLSDGDRILRREEFPASSPQLEVYWDALEVAPWRVNGTGTAKLYSLRLELPGASPVGFRVGFREIRRTLNPGAPDGADPWLFLVNGEPLFICGINWTPLLPNYADSTEEKYRDLIGKYRKMGVNLFRVWGGASREKDLFYELCDEAGILVWQEFPLSSSGIENLPPEDPVAIAAMRKIVGDYVSGLCMHPSLALWCGGNELIRPAPGNEPCSEREPMLRMMAETLRELDPERIFVPTSASGPSEWADRRNFGKGLHFDVHGPWNTRGRLEDEWISYWLEEDALFRSEVGMPAAADAAVIRKYAGEAAVMPIAASNPLWRYPLNWWLQADDFVVENGRPPESLEEYVSWSQGRQARALSHAAECCLRRFPACGGIIIWMGHDSFPCPANTSLIDFDGNLKPAAPALAGVFRRSAGRSV